MNVLLLHGSPEQDVCHVCIDETLLLALDVEHGCTAFVVYAVVARHHTLGLIGRQAWVAEADLAASLRHLVGVLQELRRPDDRYFVATHFDEKCHGVGGLA